MAPEAPLARPGWLLAMEKVGDAEGPPLPAALSGRPAALAGNGTCQISSYRGMG